MRVNFVPCYRTPDAGICDPSAEVVTEFDSHDDAWDAAGVAFSFATLAENQIIEFTGE